MQYRPTPEEFDDVPVSAASVEPMPRPDYKARRHARPVRTVKPCAVRDRRRWWGDDAEVGL